MSNFYLWRQFLDSIKRFKNAEHNRSLCDVRVLSRVLGMPGTDLESDQF